MTSQSPSSTHSCTSYHSYNTTTNTNTNDDDELQHQPEQEPEPEIPHYTDDYIHNSLQPKVALLATPYPWLRQIQHDRTLLANFGPSLEAYCFALQLVEKAQAEGKPYVSPWAHLSKIKNPSHTPPPPPETDSAFDSPDWLPPTSLNDPNFIPPSPPPTEIEIDYDPLLFTTMPPGLHNSPHFLPRPPPGPSSSRLAPFEQPELEERPPKKRRTVEHLSPHPLNERSLSILDSQFRIERALTHLVRCRPAIARGINVNFEHQSPGLPVDPVPQFENRVSDVTEAELKDPLRPLAANAMPRRALSTPEPLPVEHHHVPDPILSPPPPPLPLTQSNNQDSESVRDQYFLKKARANMNRMLRILNDDPESVNDDVDAARVGLGAAVWMWGDSETERRCC